MGITKGEYEPNEDECEWPSESEDEDESALAKEVNEKAKLEEEKKAEEEKDVKGVPQFWLTIFKNVEMIADMIQEADEPALETLKDVTLTFSEKNPMGFPLHFHFGANDFFTNEIMKCTGCTIDWKKGKNLTVKQVKKKQKHKSKG